MISLTALLHNGKIKICLNTNYFGGFASDLEIIYPKMCPFADFNRPKLDLCTDLQQKRCIGEHISLVVMELLNNADHIRQMDFGDLPQIWK